MTVRVEQSFRIPAPVEDVWAFISDPAKRAGAISVVDDFEVGDDGVATWYLDLPLRLLSNAFAIETREVERDPPRHVRFVGRSKVMSVQGEHDLDAVDGGTRLTNRFVVDGRVPGVERFFERNLPGEIDNLERAIRADLGVEVVTDDG